MNVNHNKQLCYRTSYLIHMAYEIWIEAVWMTSYSSSFEKLDQKVVEVVTACLKFQSMAFFSLATFSLTSLAISLSKEDPSVKRQQRKSNSIFYFSLDSVALKFNRKQWTKDENESCKEKNHCLNLSAKSLHCRHKFTQTNPIHICFYNLY